MARACRKKAWINEEEQSENSFIFTLKHFIKLWHLHFLLFTQYSLVLFLIVVLENFVLTLVDFKGSSIIVLLMRINYDILWFKRLLVSFLCIDIAFFTKWNKLKPFQWEE